MAGHDGEREPEHIGERHIPRMVVSLVVTIALLVGVRVLLDPTSALGAPVPPAWRVQRGDGFALAMPGTFAVTTDRATLGDIRREIGLTDPSASLVMFAATGDASDPDAIAVAILRSPPVDPAAFEKELRSIGAAGTEPISVDGRSPYRAVDHSFVDGVARVEVAVFVLSGESMWTLLIEGPDDPDANDEAEGIVASFTMGGSH